MVKKLTLEFARIDSRESFTIETSIFVARQADSHESLEFPIRANHATKFVVKDAYSVRSVADFGVWCLRWILWWFSIRRQEISTKKHHKIRHFQGNF